jgi:hypothetical protein
LNSQRSFKVLSLLKNYSQKCRDGERSSSSSSSSSQLNSLNFFLVAIEVEGDRIGFLGECGCDGTGIMNKSLFSNESAVWPTEIQKDSQRRARQTNKTSIHPTKILLNSTWKFDNVRKDSQNPQ